MHLSVVTTRRTPTRTQRATQPTLVAREGWRVRSNGTPHATPFVLPYYDRDVAWAMVDGQMLQKTLAVVQLCETPARRSLGSKCPRHLARV